jgi:hypothetical protein
MRRSLVLAIKVARTTDAGGWQLGGKTGAGFLTRFDGRGYVGSCMKCGKRRVRKGRDGLRKCPRCGVLPGLLRLNRSGAKPDAQTIGTPQSEAIHLPTEPHPPQDIAVSKP